MRGLILILLVTLASLANAEQPQQVIDVQHDSLRGATCWIIPGTGISCLPDSLLHNATPKTQKKRVSPASSTPENDGLNAGSLPHNERVRL